MELPTADRELMTMRRIPAPRARVWTAFTRSAGAGDMVGP